MLGLNLCAKDFLTRQNRVFVSKSLFGCKYATVEALSPAGFNALLDKALLATNMHFADVSALYPSPLRLNGEVDRAQRRCHPGLIMARISHGLIVIKPYRHMLWC